MNTKITRRKFVQALGSLSIVAMPTRACAARATAGAVNDVALRVKAITFDVFGTVVDWRTSIIREGQMLSQSKGITVDWPKFADAWRAGYRPAIDRVRKGTIPWASIDRIHRMILDELVHDFGIRGLSEAELDHFNRAWHRLIPWPDSIAGLQRLKSQFIIATLSNGNVSLLVEMAKNAGLPWDCVLSAEMSGHYKPDPEIYLSAVRLLGFEKSEVMLVATHRGDLEAAKKVGMKTAFVPRPLERGPGGAFDSAPDVVDIVATDFIDLAAKLGA